MHHMELNSGRVGFYPGFFVWVQVDPENFLSHANCIVISRANLPSIIVTLTLQGLREGGGGGGWMPPSTGFSNFSQEWEELFCKYNF